MQARQKASDRSNTRTRQINQLSCLIARTAQRTSNMAQDNNTTYYSDDHHHVGVGGEEEHGQQQRAPAPFDVLVLPQLSLSCGSSSTSTSSEEASAARTPPPPPLRRRRHRRRRGQEEAFACRTCGRQFATFQALGGHRTSHLRPRRATTKPTTKAHACATCGLRFSTGQALGGHMRRHRVLGLPAAADQVCGPFGAFVDLERSTARPSSASLHLLNLFV